LRLSWLSHLLTVLLLGALGWVMHLSWPYWVGVAITAGLLAWEHSLVRPGDLSRVNVAFFNINSYISVTLLMAVLGALWV
jgi:4-hydroxybenzoate polyprenyltransferase